MDCIVHGVTKSWTRLNNFHFNFRVDRKVVFSPRFPMPSSFFPHFRPSLPYSPNTFCAQLRASGLCDAHGPPDLGLILALEPCLSLLDTSLKVKVKGTQSCLTLCDPMDYTVHGILQARILEWVAIPFSKGSSQGPWKMFY